MVYLGRQKGGTLWVWSACFRLSWITPNGLGSAANISILVFAAVASIPGLLRQAGSHSAGSARQGLGRPHLRPSPTDIDTCVPLFCLRSWSLTDLHKKSTSSPPLLRSLPAQARPVVQVQDATAAPWPMRACHTAVFCPGPFGSDEAQDARVDNQWGNSSRSARAAEGPVRQSQPRASPCSATATATECLRPHMPRT